MAHLVNFGVFDFDIDSRELRRNGRVVHLQAQPSQVLAFLVSRAGHLVTRDELRTLLWGTETFVDFDRALNFCISQIRTALRDSATSPAFIRTLPKQGYQFIYPVTAVPDRTQIPPPSQLVPESRALRRNWFLFGAVGLIVLCVCGALAAAWSRPSDVSNVAVVRFDNETGDPSLDNFADVLTDNVVERLTASSEGRFRVIGNAAILRQPRSERDLSAIGSRLNASYVILGQIQRSGGQFRILAHLIRLPDQTHLWVVRLDRPMSVGLGGETAQQISSEFTPRLQSASK